MQENEQIQEIPLSEINLDRETQIRVEVSEETVQRYYEIMENEAGRDNFPPILLFHDQEGNYWLADGHHRVMAALRRKFTSIMAIVRPGTKADAIWEAAKANGSNALQLSGPDIHRAIEMLADAYPDRSNRVIAEVLGCNEKTVRKYRPAKSVADVSATEKRIGRDGKSYSAKRIRKAAKSVSSTENARNQKTTDTDSGKLSLLPKVDAATCDDRTGFRPGSLPTKKYIGKTQLKPIPRDRPDILVANLIAFFPQEFVPNTAREIFKMLHGRYGNEVIKPLLAELNEKYGFQKG